MSPEAMASSGPGSSALDGLLEKVPGQALPPSTLWGRILTRPLTRLDGTAQGLRAEGDAHGREAGQPSEEGLAKSRAAPRGPPATVPQQDLTAEAEAAGWGAGRGRVLMGEGVALVGVLTQRQCDGAHCPAGSPVRLSTPLTSRPELPCTPLLLPAFCLRQV